MYNGFFGFKEKPFKLVPNPDFLFLGKSHEEALAHLNYATTQGDGFVEITGEVGTGKTTLCRVFLENLDPSVDAAFIFNTSLDASGLLKAINRELSIDATAETPTELIHTLNNFLVENSSLGRSVILLIDEAQNLSVETLEQLRMLSNLETTKNKLIQIILVGQPELEKLLGSHALRQLGQRINLSCRLLPMTLKETREYIDHRINVASRRRADIFTPGAQRSIYDYSGGIPRLVNIACDRALVAAYGLDRTRVDRSTAKLAIRELCARRQKQSTSKPRLASRKFILPALFLLAALVILPTAAYRFFSNSHFSVTAFPVSPASPPPPSIDGNSITKPSTSAPSTSAPSTSAPTHSATAHSATAHSTPDHSENPLSLPTSPTSQLQLPNSLDPPKSQPAVNTTFTISPSKEEKLKPDGAKNREDIVPDPMMVAREKSVPFSSVKTIHAYLDQNRTTATREAALGQTISIWKQDIPPSTTPISPMVGEIKDEYDFFKIAAIEQGLDVIRLDRDFSTVKQLNLPAIVPFTLPDQQGPGYLLLVAITADNEWVIVAGKNTTKFRVSQADLEPFLTGTAYIPYRERPGQGGITSELSPGTKVIKLKLLLRQLGFQGINLGPDYDTNLRQAIIQIQSENGIRVDGLAGPITRILLYNRIESPSTPRLRRQDDR